MRHAPDQLASVLSDAYPLRTGVIPQRLFFTSGKGEGSTPLNAFDNALLNAGIGNLNLIRVSSVVPPLAEVRQLSNAVVLSPGMLVPAVYSFRIGRVPGITLSSAIAIALPRDRTKNGMIFETNIKGPIQRARQIVECMIRESFEVRGYEIDSISITAEELTITSRCGCVVSAVLMLP